LWSAYAPESIVPRLSFFAVLWTTAPAKMPLADGDIAVRSGEEGDAVIVDLLLDGD
jgi:hypothetical protein